MARFRLVPSLLVAAVLSACGTASQTPASPTAATSTDASTTSPAPAVPPGPCTIGFDGLQVNGAAFDRHAACGVTITAANAQWQTSTTYGSPAPFVQFVAAGGTTLTGDVTLQSADGAFTFTSVDIYSSTTKIPYEITGSARGAVVFVVQGVQGNTFGRFATIANPHARDAIDTLRVRLTNPAASCCRNPVGLDNIRLVW